jgi:O-antigen/teichoic acid export membrane protein
MLSMIRKNMRSRKKTALVTLVFQSFSMLMALASGVYLVPLYLAHIPPDLYGAWQASGNVLTWATMLDPGLSSIIQQRVALAYGKGDRHAVSGWIATGLWVAAGISFTVLILGLACSYQLTSWLKLREGATSAELEHAFRWSVMGGALMLLSFSVSAINQGLQSSLGTGSVSAAASIARLVVVLLLLQRGYGLVSIALSSVLMGTALLAGNLLYLFRRLRQEGICLAWIPSRMRELGTLISFMTMGRVAGILVNNVDLFLIARVLGPESVNAFRFTRTAPDLWRTIIDRPAVAMYPAFTHLVGAGEGDRARKIALRLLRITIWTTALLAFGFLFLNGEFLRVWVGDGFYAGATVNVLLVGGFVMATGSTAFSGLCFATGNVRASNQAYLAQAVVYLPMLLGGVYLYGMAGAAAASLLSILVTQAWYMPKQFFTAFRATRGDALSLLKSGMEAMLAGALPAVLFHHSRVSGWSAFVGLAACYFFSYLAILLLLSEEGRKEVRNVWRLVQQRLPNRNFE